MDDKTRLNSVYGIIAKYTHIARMQAERDGLTERCSKLSAYYVDHFSELDAKQRDLMAKQLTAMRAYSDILQQRISYDIQYYSK